MAFTSYFLSQFIDLAQPVIHSGFAYRSFEQLAHFLQVDVGMRKPNFSHLPKFLGQRFKADLLLQQLDVIDLPYRGADRFVQVGRFAIDDPVYGVAHIAHDAYVLELEQRLMRPDDAEQFNDFLAFLDV